MDQTVNIPFNIKIEPGDSSFTLDLPQVSVHHPKLRYGFTTMTVCPDYYSTQAFKLEMDSERELKEIVSNEISLEVELEKNVFDQNTWQAGSAATNVGLILKSINSHYERYKPQGCLLPLIVFDWVHLESLSAGTNFVQFHKDKAKMFYGTAYDEKIHGNWLPTAFRDNGRLNNMLFPTELTQEVLSSIRIRMTVAPNVTVAFSNSELPEAIGFSPSQLGAKVRNQIHIKNATTKSFERTFCQLVPKLANQVFTTKIHLYPTETFIVSPVATLQTTKERERKPDLMAEDYNVTISSLANLMNLSFQLQNDVANKKFKFIYPSTQGIKINVKVPIYIGHRLGYGHVEYIRPTMDNASYPGDVDVQDVEKTSRVLVYDVGMLVVSLDQRSSQQTHQFTDTFMALLEPEFSGVLKTPQTLELPFVPVSQFRKELTFVFSRFNESNQPVPLDWKVGAFVRGMLVGKV